MEHKFNRGKVWDGVSSKEGTVLYEGVEKTLSQWSLQLKTNPHSLRARIVKAERGEICWEEAMSDEIGRARFSSERSREKRKAHSKKMLAGAEKRRKEKNEYAKNKKSVINSFLYS